MSNRDHEQLYRRLIDEVFNQGRLDVADELISHHSVDHQRGGLGDGPEGVKRTAKMLRAAFSNFSLTIEDIVVDGDQVWARQRGGGTNDGSFLAFPPLHITVRRKDEGVTGGQAVDPAAQADAAERAPD